ncbi:hypothetical protein HELRODRAFT_173963 [Helobdella robusta]|uniref:Nucleotide-diphospho-sugar transferase domain-containing protein n=1 Tax=Helobdella robusta TaxID=6412 RepID=T1F7F2_HELRO|nr:hypothetical protein HELRODRAFT_173963 [Helobdella robusta]ESO03083.1 hypothetical protein HELRODRAFT_173963 [Helobdella robusta]
MEKENPANEVKFLNGMTLEECLPPNLNIFFLFLVPICLIRHLLTPNFTCQSTAGDEFLSEKTYILMLLILVVFCFLSTNYLLNKRHKQPFIVLMINTEVKEVNIDDPQTAEEIEQMRQKLNFYQSTRAPKKLLKLINSKENARQIKSKPSATLVDGLKKHSSPVGDIILSVTDADYVSFALNFYYLSIVRNKIQNFLFVCLDKQSYETLTKLDIPASMHSLSFILKNDFMSSDFGKLGYIYKTNLKTAVMVQALSLGYSVLMCDVDVIMFKNPFTFFTCSNCSIHIQKDRQMYNSGFVYAKPTKTSKYIYEKSWNLFVKYQKSHDQSYLNMAIHQLAEKENVFDALKVLSRREFPCGLYYFEEVHRPFKNEPPCVECAIMHNNYLGSVAAKLYRLKENHFWIIDSKGYYSDPNAKYITYDNPVHFEKIRTMDIEISSLKSALAIASVLNRILILPPFHCCNCHPDNKCSHPKYRCSLLSMLRISKFDQYFKLKYREHSFLDHPLVPDAVKSSVSPELLINHSTYRKKFGISSEHFLNPKNAEKGASLEEVETWLTNYSNYSVIKLHSLYGASSFQHHTDNRYTRLENIFADAFECTEYEQWEKNFLAFK